jgi:acyl-ACP thioesterase
MPLNGSIWTQQYTPRKLGLVGLLGLVQESAELHGAAMGHGYEDMMREETIWVVIRQKLMVSEWPKATDAFEIRTWVRPMKAASALRDFDISIDGRKIGEGTTCWMTLDLHSRRPVRIQTGEKEMHFRPDGHVPFDAKKFELPADALPLTQLRVTADDLDMNGHVSNIRYAKWIQDATSITDEAIRGYEVNFLAEAHLADDVQIDTITNREFEGRKISDQKPVFRARLLW